ncbi:MAG: tetratricopeptide repeat protein [Pseudomonadota bacterium]
MERSFSGELIHRRVPQFLGAYVAGVWLSIEFGGWLNEQLSLPQSTSWLIFLFMVSMVPAVALLAWRYGAPGKDEAKPYDRPIYIVNLLVAIALVGYYVTNPVTTPEDDEVAVADSAAVVEAPDTPPAMLSFRLRTYFWPNRTAEQPDWYGYAIPFLLSEDIDRASQSFMVQTPFSSDSLMETMRVAGFERMIGEPQALQLEEARRANYQYFLRGEVSDTADGDLKLTYSLHDTRDGRAVVTGEQSANEDNLFEVIDIVSAELQQTLIASLDQVPEVTDLPMSDTVTNSLPAMQKFIEARLANDLDRDLARANELLVEATELDPQFAEAYASLGLFYYLAGQLDDALPALNKALDNRYRLSREMQFRLRYARAAMQNRLDEAIDIVRLWTETEPNNESAFSELARLNLFASGDLDEALAALARVREINPQALDTYRREAAIYSQNGQFDKAEASLQAFLQERPDDVASIIQLADMQLRLTRFDEASANYRKASLIDSRSVDPELGQISVLMRKGEYSQARDRMETLRKRELTDDQLLEIVTLDFDLYALAGQYQQSIVALKEFEPVARRVLPPLLYSLQFEGAEVVMMVLAGMSTDQAVARLDEIISNTQPPWDQFLRSYELPVRAVAKDPEGYARSLAEIEAFAGAQNNNNLELQLNVARAHNAVLAGEPDKAREFIDLSLEAAKTSVLNLLNNTAIFNTRTDMYDLLRQIGEPALAVDGLRQILAEYPGYSLAHLRLAQALFALNDKTAARAALNRALELWQNADEGFVYVAEANALAAALDEA